MSEPLLPREPTRPADTTLPPEPPKDASVEEIEQDIVLTRERLGETIDALEEKLDVSAQAKRKVNETKAQLADRVVEAKVQLTQKVGQAKTQVGDRVDQTKTQLGDKVDQTRSKASGTWVQLNQQVRKNPRNLVPAAAGAVVSVGLLIWRKVRRNRNS